jgi:hypothetical protein
MTYGKERRLVRLRMRVSTLEESKDLEIRLRIKPRKSSLQKITQTDSKLVSHSERH